MMDDERTVVSVDITPTGDGSPIHREFEIESVAPDHRGNWVLLDGDGDGDPRAILDDEDMTDIVGEMFEDIDLEAYR